MIIVKKPMNLNAPIYCYVSFKIDIHSFLFCSAPEAQNFTSQIKFPAVDTAESTFD
jgi:hypothetical protein